MTLPQPATATDLYLEAILRELRVLTAALSIGIDPMIAPSLSIDLREPDDKRRTKRADK